MLSGFVTDFPKRMKWLREQAGLSQGALAKKIGVSRPFICMLESGAREPSLKVYREIVETLSGAVSERMAKRGWWETLPEGNGDGE